MKIVRLQAENLKRLVAVDITPPGDMVEITGKNGAGKSSILDSIWYALGGKEGIPGEPVRKGQKAAKVRIDLGDIIVERRFQAESGSTSLVVTNADGLRFPSPQAVLDKLVGTLTFDPLAFTRQKPEAQAETLARLVGLDLSKFEAEYDDVYEERRGTNRDVDRLKIECEQLPQFEAEPPAVDVAAAEIAIQEAKEKDREAGAVRQQAKSAAGAAARADENVAGYEARIKALKQELAVAETNLERAIQDHATAASAAQAAQAAADALPGPCLDNAIAAFQEAQGAAVRRRDWLAAEKKRGELSEAQARAKALSARLDEIEAAMKQAVADCTFPLPDLTLDEDTVRYRDVPFDQCSSAEQLRISTAIAMALNPKLRIIRITDGSLLDSDSFALLAAMAREHDMQVWVEVVESARESAVVIEDGRVAAAAREAGEGEAA